MVKSNYLEVKVMGIKEELGKRIKALRIQRGYTQDKLSELIDISQRALSSIELGENFVTSETLDKLLAAFEITSEEFFATNKYKTSDELLKMINLNLLKIGENPEKLEIVLNLTNSLARK